MKKLTYEFIREKFEKEGYTLLSEKYINNYTKLDVICPKGHKYSMSYKVLRTGHSCAYCAKQGRPTYQQIKETYEREGYTLLDGDNYKNAHSKLTFICSKGHTHSNTYNSFKLGRRCKTCKAEKASKINNKGNVTRLNLPLYETYATQLEKYQVVYKVVQNNLELLGIECMYCKRIFVPDVRNVRNKLNAIKGTQMGEAHLYCSNECKQACPVYGQILWPKGYKPFKNERPNQKQWADLVKERDNYTCQNCGSTEGKMVAHHIDPVINNPIESTDIDNGISLCEKCHLQVHKLEGCTYNDLRC